MVVPMPSIWASTVDIGYPIKLAFYLNNIYLKYALEYHHIDNDITPYYWR